MNFKADRQTYPATVRLLQHLSTNGTDRLSKISNGAFVRDENGEMHDQYLHEALIDSKVDTLNIRILRVLPKFLRDNLLAKMLLHEQYNQAHHDKKNSEGH